MASQARRLGVLVVAVAAALVLLRGRSGERGAVPITAVPIFAVPPDSEFAGTVEAERRVGPWEIRVLRDTVSDERVFDLKRLGRRAWAVRAANIRLLFVARDVTGDSVPDVVVEQFSGGMHCCTSVTVLGLGPRLVVHGVIFGDHGEVEFEDLDGDGVLEARIGDFRFAYWREYAFVETPVPEVILRFGPNGYQPACDLMRRAPPDSAELAERTAELSDGWTGGDPPAGLWGYALDLIYRGHAGLAFEFLDRAWPRVITGKEDFITEFRGRLQGNPCWSAPPPPRPAA